MKATLVVRRFAMVVVLGAVAMMAGCSTPIPEAAPMPTLSAGTWVSEDGQYSITLEENPNAVHVVLPEWSSESPWGPCGHTGVFPATRSGDGSWTVYEHEYGAFLSFDFTDSARSGDGVRLARDGDWSVLLSYPCGPDYDPLYLVRQGTAAPSE